MSAKAAKPRRIALPPALGPAEAEGFADSLRALRGAPVELAAGETRRLGGQCVQILLAAAAAWAADGQSFRLVEPSAEVSEALRLLGVDERALIGESA